MKRITKIEENKALLIQKKIRVAAYCRVSMASDEQLISLEAQKVHYEDYIKSNDEWEYAGLYYDEYNQRLIPFDTKMAVQTPKITAFEGEIACRKPLFLFLKL